MAEDYVIVKNHGDTVWNDGQLLHPYAIPPGGEKVVPWNVMCVWLGDPDARDSIKNPQRQEEKSRLHLYYGVTSGAPNDKRPTWADAMPRLTVHNMATGEEIATVASDPDGLSAAAAPVLELDDTTTQIQLLKQRLEELERSAAPTAAAIAQSDDPVALTTPDIAEGAPPADTPSPRPRARGRVKADV
jgi:hypothetical protein